MIEKFEGVTVRIPAKAPRLKGSKIVPFVVVPSAKIHRGAKPALSTSMAFCLSMNYWTIRSFCSLLPMRFTKRHCMATAMPLTIGSFEISSFGVKLGFSGETTRLRISMKPI